MLSRCWGRSTLQLLADAALGHDCTLCGAAARDLVCAACTADLPLDPVRDPVVTAAFAYAFPVDALVHRFKDGGDLAIGAWLARRMLVRLRSEPRPDLLVAPPLSPARLRERGFNQSWEIACTLSRHLGVPRAMRGIRKRRDTLPQQALGRRARLRNLRGAFACTRRFDGQRIAIVDDVVTTGATTHSLALVLRRAGAREVVVWSIARAPRRGR